MDKTTPPRTAAATEAVEQYAAERAVDDPAKLRRAARIVRTALARERLTIDELVATAPPMTAEQAERLRAFLPPSTPDTREVAAG